MTDRTVITDDVGILEDLITIASKLDADGFHDVANAYQDRIHTANTTLTTLVELRTTIGLVLNGRNNDYWEDGRDLANELIELGWTPPENLPTREVQS